jgi:hypothetical protein
MNKQTILRIVDKFYFFLTALEYGTGSLLSNIENHIGAQRMGN